MSRISDYGRSLGLMTKTEVKKIAPKDARWGCFDGSRFYKVIDDKSYTFSNDGVGWFLSSMRVEDLTEANFYKLG